MCRVKFEFQVEQDLLKLDQAVRQRIFNKVKWLAENVESLKLEPLSQDFKGFFKLRVGDYRAIYTQDRNSRLIRIHLVGHRSQVYKLR